VLEKCHPRAISGGQVCISSEKEDQS